MIAITRASFARISSRSLIRSIKLGVFRPDLVDFQAGQLVEAQIQDRVGLLLAERIAPARQPRFAANQNAELLHLGAHEVEGEQLDLGFLAIGRVANDADELVQVGEGDQVAFQQFRPLFRLASSNFVRRITTSRRCSM